MIIFQFALAFGITTDHFALEPPVAKSAIEAPVNTNSLEDAAGSVVGPADDQTRPTRVRFQVLAAACSLAVITYIHRVGFATASAGFKSSLELSDTQLGWLMAAFMLGYGLLEIPWGALGDRFGVRKILAAVVLSGSCATACLAFVFLLPRNATAVFLFLLVLRFLFGAVQAGTFPAFSRMMADWMPTTERGGAQGAIWMSSRMGGFLAPLLMGGLFTMTGGWEMPLVLVAILGIGWCAAFWPWYRNRPEEMAGVNRSERALIEAGRNGIPSTGHEAIPWARMARNRSVWALWLTYGFFGFSGNFYLTMLPTYLENHRHLDARVAWWLSALPFGFGVVACQVGGSLSDAIIRRRGKAWGRRLVGAAGLIAAGSAIIAIPWVPGVWGLGFLLVLAFFGNDLSMAPAWAAAADIGGRHTGTLAGGMNMVSSFMAAIQVIVIGRLFDSGDLVSPFLLLALGYALGTFTWLGVDVRQTLADPR